MKRIQILLFFFLPFTAWAQFQAGTTPEALFGHLIGTDISEYPEFKREISYGFVELGMMNLGKENELLGINVESEVGFAFYKGKLCSISFEYKNNDMFDALTNLLGMPRYADTRNEMLGELYSFVWQGERIKVSYPVFNYGNQGSQYITIEDIAISRAPAIEAAPATGMKTP